MRIRNKIAILYTQLTFMVLLGALTFVYVMTTQEAEGSFYNQLWDRAINIAQVDFEKDEMTESAYNAISDVNKFKLHQESSLIFDVSQEGIYDSLMKVVHNDFRVRQLLNGKTVEYRNDERQNIGIYYPDNSGNYVVLVSAYDKAGVDSQRNLLELLLIILVVSTVLVFLIGLLYAKQVMSPIMDIINNVKRIKANNLRRSLREERGNDELSELSRTFNDMIERLRNSFDMQSAFIRNASHELKNPLTAILGETEIALSKPRTEGEYVATLETVLVETERLNSLIKDLLSLAQTDFDFSRIPQQRVDVAKMIQEARDHLGKSISANVKVNVVWNKDYAITGVDSLLKIAFLNLIGNGCKFSDNKPVNVFIYQEEERVVIDVADQGIGIPQSELSNIFDPFYRAANTSGYKGTGIGLALSMKIINLHAGKVSVNSEIGVGTTITVKIPFAV